MSLGIQSIVIAVAVLGACVAWLRVKSNPFHQPGENPLSTLKTLVEIVAIVLAGFWAYSRFVKVEEPSLATNLRFGVDLLRDTTAAGPHCVMLARAGVENASRARVRITGVTQSVWVVPDSVLWRGEPASYVDLERFTAEHADSVRGRKAFSEGGPLAYEYAPGASASYDIPWLLPRMDSTTTVLTRLDFAIAGSPDGDFYYTWGKPCAFPATPVDSVPTITRPDSVSPPPAG
jgi:hypothetical protein